VDFFSMYFQLCRRTRLLAMAWWGWRRNLKTLGLAVPFLYILMPHSIAQ